MRHLIFILFCLTWFCCLECVAQDTYSKIYHIGVENYSSNFGESILELGNDELVIMCNGFDTLTNDKSSVSYLKLYTTSGDLISKSHYHNLPGSLKFEVFGNAVINSNSQITVPGALDTNLMCLNLTAQGDSLGLLSLSTSTVSVAKKLILDQSDNIIAAGFADDLGGWKNMLLVKWDENGNKLWHKTFESGAFDSATSLSFDHDGGYILCGPSNGFKDGAFTSWVIKTDTAGNKLWDLKLGELDKDLVQFPHRPLFYAHPDGNYIYSSYDDNTIIDDVFGLPFISMVDSTGATLWRTDIPSIRGVTKIKVLKDGNVFLISQGIVSQLKTNRIASIAKFNSTGDLLWHRFYSDHRAAENFYLYDVIEGSDGYLYATGAFDDQVTQPVTSYGVWLLKLDQNGCLEPDCEGDVVYLNSEHTTFLDEQSVLLKIFPNPVDNYLTVNIKSDLTAQQKILLTDINGKRIWEKLIKHGEQTLNYNTSDLPSGQYFLSVTVEGEKVLGKKVWVQH